MGQRYLSEKPLVVAEQLRGQPLASPSRRAVAFGIDMGLLVLPSLVVALGAALAGLWVSQPKALGALRTLIFGGRSVPPAAEHAALRELAPLLVRFDAEGLPPEVREAVRAGKLDRAADELAKRRLIFAMSFSDEFRPELAEGEVRFPVERLIPQALRGLALYGVAALYFGVLTRGRKQATLGKRVAGIRVVRLDGERLTLWESFERFVGYLHIPGTLFVGLADLWRDPNRRLAHDRVVHTAVLRDPRKVRARG